MPRATPARSARGVARPAPVLIAAPAGASAFVVALAGELRARARVVTALPEAAADLDGVRLALAVMGAGAPAGERALADWAMRVRVPSLAIVVAPPGLRIGPLTCPGRVGCGECGRQRMAAAALGRARAQAEPPVLDEPALSALCARTLAREVRGLLRRESSAARLLDHVLCLDTTRATASLHRVIPLSRCPACGGAAQVPVPAPPVAALDAAAGPRALLEALAGYVDPVTGVIPGVAYEQDTGLDELCVVSAAPPHVFDEAGSPRRLPLGWGKGFGLGTALLSATGEALERYAPSLPDVASRVVWRCLDELDGQVLDPRSLALYTDEQYERAGFEWVRFDPSLRHPWVRGVWLHDDTPVWVPAVCAFLSLQVGREHLICQGTSNGLAASHDARDAGLRATLELVERDALLTAWLTGRRAHRIALDDTLEPELMRLVAGLERLGARVECHALTTAACGSVVLALALGDGRDWPGATLGLGASLDPRAALRQALLELGQTGPHLRRLLRAGQPAVPGAPHDVRDMLQHALYYFPAERAQAFDALRGVDAPLPLAELDAPPPAPSLDACRDALAAGGVRVALVDVTSPDVALGPFRVARALSPDLQPLTYGWGCARQPVARVRALGLRSDAPEIHPIW